MGLWPSLRARSIKHRATVSKPLHAYSFRQWHAARPYPFSYRSYYRRSAGAWLGRTANGALIEAAEQTGFDLMVTTDKNIRYQQNLEGRKLALIVLGHSQWPMVKMVTARIVTAVNAAVSGSYLEVEIPFKE